MEKVSSGIKKKIIRLLDEREKRADLQEEVRKKYEKPIAIIKVNFPGIDKNNQITQNIVQEITKNFVENIGKENICHVEEIQTLEGLIRIFAIDMDSKSLKSIAVQIEEGHALGRFVDLDVIDETGKGISRVEIGYERRKCYLCDEMAHICVRSRAHSEEDIKEYILSKYEEYLNV